MISIQRQISDGKIFQVNCSISHSCPFSPPSLYWKKNPLLENLTSMAFSEKISGQWVYTETLQGRATHKMHNSKVSCLGYYKESQTTINILCEWYSKMQWIYLHVSWELSYYFNCMLWFPVSTDKPVTVTLKLGNKPVIEGGSIIMECAADCNPQPHTYSWFKREMGQHIRINSTGRKTFNNITRDTSISCIAHNDIGAGQSAWLDLDVQRKTQILLFKSMSFTDIVKDYSRIQCYTFTTRSCSAGHNTREI